jgi:hypothetical protein
MAIIDNPPLANYKYYVLCAAMPGKTPLVREINLPQQLTQLSDAASPLTARDTSYIGDFILAAYRLHKFQAFTFSIIEQLPAEYYPI